MLLTQAQISHLGKLTALKGGDISLESVIRSFDALAKVNTDSQNDIRRSGNSTLRLREDIVREDESLPDKLLFCSQQKKAAHQIVLGGIMHGE